ncbi:MAG: hypothetical protein U1F35_05470 [Steroidobacteraceae bacterium]
MPTSASDLAFARLQAEEGFRSSAYRDTAGNLTIGYGFNIDAGISQYCALALMDAQLAEITRSLSGFWWWAALDDVRASVLLDLGFNLGVNGLLHFPKMLAAVGAKNWKVAHDELLDSAAARSLPQRYQRLAQILLTGQEGR